eukprot:gene18076-2055_t
MCYGKKAPDGRDKAPQKGGAKGVDLHKVEDPGDGKGPLPRGWSFKKKGPGEKGWCNGKKMLYFIDHNTKKTSFNDPRA